MATRAPVQPGAASTAAAPTVQQTADSAVRTVVLTIGAVALWMALVLGMEQVNRRAFGMAGLDAWGLALSVVSYIAIFIGFMVGVITLILHADRRQEEREG